MEDSCSFKQGGENVHEFAYLQCENHTQYNAMQMQDLLEAAAPIPISHCSSMVKAIAKEIRYIDCQQVCSEQLLALHTDTWVYKNSKHEFCVLASMHDVKTGPH